MGCSKSSSKRKVYNKIILPQERKISNNLTLHLEEIEKEEQTNPKVVEGKKS